LIIKTKNPLDGRRREIRMKSIVLVVWILIAWLLPLSLHDVIPFRSVPAAFSAPKSSLIATEKEVREFFAQYIERYNKREIEEFLWLFSLKAKQNQQDGLPEIRVIYNDLFNRSRSLQLSLEDMKIEIYQNAVEVKARYSVNQVLKEGGRKKVWKGNAHWVLTKEEGKLQVLTVDYEYSIPPTLAGEKMPAPLPLLAKEEEVKQFFSNYVDRYQRKDIGGFLSFFSPKAVHNQRDRIEEIRSIYSKFFDESKALRFQVEGMKTEIYQNRVEVKARFRVEQTLKKGEKEIIWTGNIRWVLGSEDGALKIVSLDYQNDKSP
jgi:ketosteroid isomerase-like protein